MESMNDVCHMLENKSPFSVLHLLLNAQYPKATVLLLILIGILANLILFFCKCRGIWYGCFHRADLNPGWADACIGRAWRPSLV